MARKVKSTRSGNKYHEEKLREEMDYLGTLAAQLASRISLAAYGQVADDDNYTYNLLNDAEGTVRGTLALVQAAELNHLSGESLHAHVEKARS